MRRPRIQVLLDGAGLTTDAREALQVLEARIECFPLAASSRADRTTPADARLVVTYAGPSAINDRLAQIHEWFDHDPCATLVLCDTPVDPDVAPGNEGHSRTIGFAPGRLSRDDLAGRLSTMCDLRGPMDGLRRELKTLKERESVLRDDLQQLEDELQQASVFQHDLLPATLPQIEGLRVHALYRPAGAVSGDIYDVFRLDASHVAFSLADATGHGMAAGLLCAFAKRLLDGRETLDTSRRGLEPEAVLHRLNRALCDARLPECQFVAALHAVYDEKARSVRWARGGMPYPILVRRGDRPRQIASAGPVAGASAEATFELTELPLEAGDTLLFHTDGLDALLRHSERGPEGGRLDRTAWFQALGSRPIGDSLGELHRPRVPLGPPARETDDLTILALHVPEVTAVGSGAGNRSRSGVLCVAGP